MPPIMSAAVGASGSSEVLETGASHAANGARSIGHTDVISTSYSSDSNDFSLEDETGFVGDVSRYCSRLSPRSTLLRTAQLSSSRPVETVRQEFAEGNAKVTRLPQGFSQSNAPESVTDNDGPQLLLEGSKTSRFEGINAITHVARPRVSSSLTMAGGHVAEARGAQSASAEQNTAPGKKKRSHRQSMADHRRKVLLQMLQHYASVWPLNFSFSEKTSSLNGPVVGSHVDVSSHLPYTTALRRLNGSMWAEILPVCVAKYLDLYTVIQLRQTCTRLYYYPNKYTVGCCTFERWCTLTQQEIIGTVLPQLQAFLTAESLSQLNFSRCCLLTDTFPKSLVTSQTASFCRHLKSLYFDFCYALTDKSLKVLLRTPLPHLESLSLRCARSRDLTGAPFSSKELLSKTRWPRFHKLSCSCTQVTLQHLDSVALFLAERAVELSVAPKLGLSGSLASNSLIRRLGLEKAHETFVEAVVGIGTVEAAKAAQIDFEAQWVKAMDDPEIRNNVLHRLVRNRGSTILVNAPCSVAVVDDGEGHEKAVWSLLCRRHAASCHSDASAAPQAEKVIGNGAAGRSTFLSTTHETEGVFFHALPTEDQQQQRLCSYCTAHHADSQVPSQALPNLRTTDAVLSESAKTELASKLEQRAAPPFVDVLSSASSSSTGAPAIPQTTHLLNSPAVLYGGGSLATDSTESVAAGTGSTTGGGADYGQVQYSRWSYPLPLAIRLGNLPMVEFLLKRGTYVDIWGYNFATPLYIAASHVRSGAVVKEKEVCTRVAIDSVDEPDDAKHFNPTLLPQQPPISDDRLTSKGSVSDAELGAASLCEPAPAVFDKITHKTVPLQANSSAVVEQDDDDDAGAPREGFDSGIEKTRQLPVPSQITARPQLVLIPSRSLLCSCSCHCQQQPLGAVAGAAQEQRVPISDTAVPSADRFSVKDTALQIVELLLQYGAPVDAPDLYSVKCPVNAAIKNDNKELLETFLSHGATINVRALPHSIIPPLVQMCRRQQQKKLPQKSLTRLGYKSPLFVACELHAWRCVAALLDHGADPHWTDPFSNRNLTPTLLAYRKNSSILQLFISKGAGSTEATRWVLSEVLAAAILQSDIHAIQYLATLYPDLLERESGGMWSLPLVQASRLNKVAVVEELLKLGNNPNVKNPEGLTSLHFAASEGHKRVIELLLVNGAEPNVQGGQKLNTPLHIAVEENRRDVVETLVNFGADVTVKNEGELTPLMVAILARNDKVAMLLIQRSTVAQLDAMDRAQRTALTYAIYFGQFKVADALVEKGVSLRLVDMSGASTESILKEKIQSLEKRASTSALNKFFRNIVGAASGATSSATSNQGNATIGGRNAQDGGGGGGGSLYAEGSSSLFAVADKAEAGQGSDQSVRKLNAKRKKLAKQLLLKIRSKAKKYASVVASVTVEPTIGNENRNAAVGQPQRSSILDCDATAAPLASRQRSSLSSSRSTSHNSNALSSSRYPAPPCVSTAITTTSDCAAGVVPPPVQATVVGQKGKADCTLLQCNDAVCLGERSSGAAVDPGLPISAPHPPPDTKRFDAPASLSTPGSTAQEMDSVSSSSSKSLHAATRLINSNFPDNSFVAVEASARTSSPSSST